MTVWASQFHQEGIDLELLFFLAVHLQCEKQNIIKILFSRMLRFEMMFLVVPLKCKKYKIKSLPDYFL